MSSPIFSTSFDLHDCLESTKTTSVDGELCLDVDGASQALSLSRTVSALERLADSQGPWVTTSAVRHGPRGANGRIKLGPLSKAIFAIRADSLQKIHLDKEHQLHPMIVAYLDWESEVPPDLYEWLRLPLPLENAQRVAEELNVQFAALHHKLNDPMLRDKRLHQTRASRKNLKSGMRWIDHIFNRRARIRALRIDLYYLGAYGYGGDSIHAVSLNEAFDHRTTFLRQLPDTFERGFLGYMLKTEFTVRRTLHHHVLVVLDGSAYGPDMKLADMAGNLWLTVTSGRGTFHNVNKNTNRNAPTFGLGEVHVDEAQKVWNLKSLVIAYLCKHDYLVRWVVPKRHKLFLKSVAKPLQGVKRGRPRRVNSEAAVNTTGAFDLQVAGGAQ